MTELAPHLSVEELVSVYQRAEADIREGFAKVEGAIDALAATVAMGGWRGISLHDRHQAIHFGEVDKHLRHLRRQVWDALVERMQVRRAMSIAAWKKLREDLEKEEPPPIDVETVRGMLDGFRAQIPDMLKAAVDEVFDFLRPRRSGYKTNTEFEIGEKVILAGAVTAGWWKKGVERHWSVNGDWWEQRLIALENVLLLVDGRARQESDGYYSKLSTEIKSKRGQPQCHGATEFYEFRGYLNGALHLKFRRPDLVARLNAIAGGARLKPPD
jgi:hypothetical protein